VDKTITEWGRRFRGMTPKETQQAWAAKAANDVSWAQESNFHAAAAERMKQLGNMAIDLDDDTRKDLCRQANDILARLNSICGTNRVRLKIFSIMLRSLTPITRNSERGRLAIICSSKALLVNWATVS